ncbi:MAG: apolipoprotein N-acyltransferase [Pyrinomonadaceae bacterium]|nr:apolipoprotein N-acyltransferase [Pyrinomonadaceae bacterium]
MKFSLAKVKLPTLLNSLLAIFSAILLILAFPDFDLWFIAWFALVPLFCAIEREKESIVKSFILGWLFGTLFFAGSCWWLTFSFINYGGIPTPIAYFLLLIIGAIVGIFPAIFAAAFSIILKRFGTYGILSAPVLWTAIEFLRFNLTDNNWNAIGYSQAFTNHLIQTAQLGGIYLVGFWVVAFNSIIALNSFSLIRAFSAKNHTYANSDANKSTVYFSLLTSLFIVPFVFFPNFNFTDNPNERIENSVIVIQANVPMSGLNEEKWLKLRGRHVELAEDALRKLSGQRTNDDGQTTTVIFPESPMNFSYGEDAEFRAFIGDFARKHHASVLFNSAEPNPKNDNYYNSAIMINQQGAKIGQYDKIHLVPFGEFAPVPSAIKPFVPTLVGSFQYGENYNLFPVGDAQAGIMICYESHFASLSRELTRRGADVLIEMTNDGYLGNTAVLRQHLASAVFRAVETNRPVLRATNVGITAYINERGEVLDAADVYTEATRVWTVSKSDGNQTFYVRYGDWFAWLCSIVSLGLLFFSFWKKRKLTADFRG